ncbi:Zn-ribbon domain-containing OB-fold protein [Lishizhenia sp.]|uniref:Zn-ribbon domain-containing OB-fold protein n=1 Tax=Lishizhenia sp. TaxID=2497594 RepID=UPI00299D6E34|nr:OB-fold domain-containing protein [Lishizhenia sp.]MDX1447246.1 OB-fold domain-containing protein [Lishizhenia sp.]
MSAKQEFIDVAKSGKVLARKCKKCGELHLATVYFCQNCGNPEFENAILEGQGSIATYTIITVPPAGFEKYTPYAWVVLKLDNADLRVSGFMGGIAKPADLPVGTKAKIVGFDDRGILIEKQ